MKWTKNFPDSSMEGTTKNTFMDHHIHVPFPSLLLPTKMTIDADNQNIKDEQFTANDQPIKIDLNVKVLSKPKTKSNNLKH